MTDSMFVPNPARLRIYRGQTRFDVLCPTRGWGLISRRRNGAFRTKHRFSRLPAYNPRERWLYEARCEYPKRRYKWREL